MAAVPTPDWPLAERWYRRHAALVRITHWINVVCFTLLLMSGLQIFNAHPALYVGERSDFDHPTISIRAHLSENGLVGETAIVGHSFNTTGVLGVSSENGQVSSRAFPSWITIPSSQDLATGRRWHFFFAWLLVLNALIYLVWGIATRHFGRDFLPSRVELGHIGRAVREHLRLRFPRGEAAKGYNVLQQFAYLMVVFVLFPLMILTGLTMSPGIDSALPQLLTLFGGRQTARLIHFAAASGLALFVIVHVVMVLVSGVWNNLRSMVTGWYDLGEPRTTDVR
jgi:thiosulfate reductase cytochrome b subunit